jgi:hypothetical protein
LDTRIYIFDLTYSLTDRKKTERNSLTPNRAFSRLLLLSIIAFISNNPVLSQSGKGLFKDSLDNAFDISKWLFDLHGFIPLITPITEPALGYGLVGAGVYFIPKKKLSSTEFKMPDIFGLGGGYTQNGTWFLGAMYAGFWKDDQLRYRGIIGYGSINLKYYGSGNDFLANNPASFSMESYLFLQQAVIRIKKSNFFLGIKYMFGKTNVTAFEESKIPEVDPLDFDLISSGLGFISEYESFNNVLSPTQGIRLHLSYDQYLKILGSDKDNGMLTFFTLGYLPVNRHWVLGLRLESMLASENTPFYMMPYINLRGVPLLRYQGELTMLAETEQLVRVYKRWSAVGFAGIGTTIPSLNDMNKGPTAWNVGGGFRYKVARLLGLQMGVDVARGPENWAFYIVFGNAWLK